jgi:hypothetical protein
MRAENNKANGTHHLRDGSFDYLAGRPVKSNEEIEESEDVIEPPILPEVPFTKK